MKNNLILLKRFFSFICVVLIFISVFSGTGLKASAAIVKRGDSIDYSSYIPGGSWQTHKYYVDGNLAYCIQSELAMVDDGDYGTIIETFDSYPLLCKVLFYGYGGPAYKMGEFFSGYGITLTEDQAYLYTHIAANYAYGGNVWYGLDEPTAASLHLTDWIKYCSDNVCMPENKHLTGGIVKIATPEGAQRVAYLDSYTFIPITVNLEVKINFDKTKNTYGDATTHNAVYGLFDSADTEIQRITLTIPAGSDTASGSITYTFDTDGTYYVKEISAPTGYTLDTNKYYFTVDTLGQNVNFSDIHFTSVNPREFTFTKGDEVPLIGSFTFNKKDSSGNPLSGAAFDVYLKSSLSVNDGKYDFSSATPICSGITTDASGVLLSPELEYGTYIVHETIVPEGKLPLKDFEVNILTGGTVILDDKIDESIQGKFKFKKIDSNGKPLTGAGFDVYLKSSLTKVGGKWDFSSATPVGPRLKPDSTGVVTSGLLDYGTYVVHEAVVPKGKLAVDDFEVTITNNGETVSLGDKTDKTIRGKFTFKKTDSGGNPLSGAGFDVYLKSSLTKVGGKWDFSSSSPVCSRLTSDSSGVITSGLLDYGTYIVHEAVVPDGKLAVNDFEVAILNDGETVKVKDKTDKTVQGKFSLKKSGEDGLPVKGAGFSVYEKSSLSLNSDGTYDFTSATPVGALLKTDADGKLTSGLLDYGIYVVCESVVPEGYKACDPFEVKIEKQNVTVDIGNITDRIVPAKFRIIKKDSESGEIILKGGAKFKIYDIKNDVYVSVGGEDVFTTDDTGMVTTSAPLPTGSYRIEEIETPEGYLLDSSAVEISFDSTWPFTMEGADKIITAEFKNNPKRGSVEITKTGEGLTGFSNNTFVWADVNLPGAVYEIHADEDIYSPDNRGTLIHAKDDLIGTLTTDSSGYAAMDNLYLGKYYLVEITAPAGYVIDTTHKTFELSYNDSTAAPIISTNIFYDEKQNIVLDLLKSDSETGKPLAGAEFGIYADEDIYSFDGTVIVSKGELIATALSDKNGKIDFGLDLPYAKYKVKEINAPVNYVLNPAEYSFEAVYPASDVKEVSFMYSWENTPVRGSLEITKVGETLVDFKDGKFIWDYKPLKGAKFNVIAKENKQIIETIETDKEGKAKTSNLPLGNYYLVETVAPYGMVIDTTPIDFSIEYKDQNTALILTQKSILNKRQTITLNVTKSEKGSDKDLSGGKFNLYADADIKNYNGVVIVPKGTLISQAEAFDGEVDFGLDLPHSVYKITEEKAPADYYENDEEYEIDLSYTDSAIKNLTADLSIFDTRLPHFAKVMMKVKPAFKSKSKSNYITEDYGENGYSVLLISDSSALPVSSASNMWFCIFASSILLIAGSLLTMFVLIKKRKEKT